MRQPTSVELMLLTVVTLWALNLTVTRYLVTHGIQPLVYGTVRYALAGTAFVVITLVAERTLRIARRHLVLVAVASLALYVNQVAFVYAIKTTSATVVGLLLGAVPVFAALIGRAYGIERPTSRFWAGAAVSFVGVALVAVGTGGQVQGGLGGVLLGVLTAATWAAYSTSVTPLMRTYSASRISTIVLWCAWVPLALTAFPQATDQQLALGTTSWLLLAFAVIGPLVVTNILWFRSLDRIGPARATLAANLQPFVAAVLAMILLGETLVPVQWAGGLLIACGILLGRRRAPLPVPGE